MISIRQAQIDDLSALDDLMWRAAWTNECDRQVMQENAGEVRVDRALFAAGLVFLAERAAQISGFAAIEERDDVWELESVFVEPDEMGHGVGKRLVNHAFGTLLGLEQRRLFVQANEAALGFYRRLGFVETPEQPDRAGLRMVLKL